MSSFGKFLVCSIVVPAGGWVFAWHEGATHRSVTIAAGTYADINAVGRALRDALRALGGGHTTDVVSINQVGRTTITISGATAQRWDATTDLLSDMLGFAETEDFSAGSIVGTKQITHAWYPGALSHDANLYRGAGLVYGGFWKPLDKVVGQWAGSGKPAIVHPGQLPLRRALRFDIVTTDEVKDLKRGVAQLWELHRAKRLHWYLDRELGTVDAYGTKGDPRTNVDGDGLFDYWDVSIVTPPDPREVQNTSSWFSVEMVVQAVQYP